MLRNEVAFLCTFSAPVRTLNMAKILVKAGFRVTVIEWDRTGQKPTIEEKDGVRFKRLRLKAGYGLAIFPLVPFWAFFVFIEILVGHYSMLQPQNLDCLMPTLIATWLKLVRKPRIAYDLQDFYADGYVPSIPALSWVSSFLERLLVKRVDATILASERQVLQIEPKNLSQKAIVFYNLPHADPSRTYSNGYKKSKKLLLFYAGTFGPDRIVPLINVTKAIRDLPVEFLVAGYGELEDLVMRLCETHAELRFLGKLNHDEVMEFTKEADVILLLYDSTYMNIRIALGYKFFEAMAAGKLVLAPYDTYMGEIVEREKIGIVVDYRDPEGIREKIKSIICCDDETIQSFNRNAKKFYEKRFNVNRTTSRYLDLVKSLV